MERTSSSHELRAQGVRRWEKDSMATAKQIAANRANARLSTGPKTDIGRLSSSRNAFRHGLSGPLPMEGACAMKIDTMARALTDGAERLAAAREMAELQLELSRIRGVRNELMLSLDPQRMSLEQFAQQLGRVTALERYERNVFCKRRRARKKLQTRTHESAATK
jgi:hypothetical protein